MTELFIFIIPLIFTVITYSLCYYKDVATMIYPILMGFLIIIMKHQHSRYSSFSVPVCDDYTAYVINLL